MTETITKEQGLAVLDATSVRIGQRYRHYRTGNVYVVTRLGLWEPSCAPTVAYRPETNAPGDWEWFRPLELFTGLVVDNGQLVPRFALVD